MKRGEYMNKDYYTCKDIQEITGAGKSLAYEIIRKLKKSYVDFEFGCPSTHSANACVLALNFLLYFLTN